NFWIPITDTQPLFVLAGFGGVFLLLVLLPLVIRPPKKAFPPSSDLDQLKCDGCVQCVLDCPYEAISMVPRTAGSIRLSEMVAEVDPALCVSCGLCAASCARMTIGPPGRKGSDQFQIGKDLIQALQEQGEDLENQIVIIGCTNQPYTATQLKQLE